MTPAETELLATDLAGFQNDPLSYVLYAFQWGEGELVGHNGPRQWQREILEDIGKQLTAGGELGCVIQNAIASGHGIGKSALVSWIILWALSTFENTKIVVTANTDRQLTTKTWPEVAKWHRLAINASWFTFTATSLYAVDTANEKTWRADAIPWSEHNTEAFAGLHNQGRRIVVIFDEASAISDKIYQVTEGALTDENTQILWLCFGNPTRNTGRFRECFGSLGHRWNHRQIDSRTVEGTNKAQIAKWVEDYGEDSDFVRVRVRGMFPQAGSLQFIPSNVVENAATCEEVSPTVYDPIILGVDVARFGDDESAIRARRGRNARMIPPIYLRGLDTMQLAARVASVATEANVDVIFVDETGIGAGVVDRLRQLGFNVMGVNNGSKASASDVDGELVANKAAEQWALMRSWLKTGGCIDDDPELRAQLESREYGYNVHNAIVLERKDDMKKRGLSSPDRGDALALTFAYPVPPRTQMKGLGPAKPAFCITEAPE